MDQSQYDRRREELEEAESPHELDRLFAKWREQDLEDARAKTVAARRLDAMARRLHQLEAIMAALPGATGEAIAKHVKQALDHHPTGLSYVGVWDTERAYQPNVLCTHAGSLWISLAPVEKAERPGKSASWRLIAKSGSAPAGGFA